MATGKIIYEKPNLGARMSQPRWPRLGRRYKTQNQNRSEQVFGARFVFRSKQPNSRPAGGDYPVNQTESNFGPPSIL